MSNESQSDTPTPRTALEQLMSFRHDTFYGREWVLMDDAERLAKQCTQTERELIAANARIAELEAQQPPRNSSNGRTRRGGGGCVNRITRDGVLRVFAWSTNQTKAEENNSSLGSASDTTWTPSTSTI